MPGPFYFAWVGPGATTFGAEHHVYDEQIFAISIQHTEGDIPSLRLDIRNTGSVGLLAAGRNQWCWLSWDDGSSIVPIFHGRLIGIPQNLHLEVVTLEFTARPLGFDALKAALADTLRVSPYWDPIWIAQDQDTPDTVLEARSALYHVDRVSNAVTISDIIAGEDGTLDVAETEHVYAEMSVSYGQTPLTTINVTGTVTWKQQASGNVDLTQKIWEAFIPEGNRTPYPMIASLTAGGLVDDWPKPQDGMGGGWTVADGTAAALVTDVFEPVYLTRNYIDFDQAAGDPVFMAGLPAGFHQLEVQPSGLTGDGTFHVGGIVQVGQQNWTFQQQVGVLKMSFVAHYDASRDRSETVTFALEVDTQPLLTDPGDSEIEALTLSSSSVGDPVDPGGAIPIGDLALPNFFKTARGQQAFEYLLAVARARALDRARAIDIEFTCKWSKAIAISCRKNVTLHDRRLPGGVAGVTGKVKAYELKMAGNELSARITIACTVGNGNTLGAASPGTGTYAESGYMQAGYQQVTDGTVNAATGDIQYENFSDFVIDDDGVDLLNMTPDNVVDSIVILNAADDQAAAIDAGIALNPPDPKGALDAAATIITLNLKSVQGGAFQTSFAPVVGALMVPKTIDLEAT